MTYLTLGASSATGDTMVSPYSDGGLEPAFVSATYTGGGAILHYIATWTNTSGNNRTVREIGLGSSGGISNMGRRVLDLNAMANFCVMPNNSILTIDWFYNIHSPSIVTVNASLNLSGVTGTSPIFYNGVDFPNPSLSKISPAYGASGWEISCYTETYAEIDALNAYAGPIQTGTSITGQQYVVSAFSPGILQIKDQVTGAYVAYNNCYILAPIDVTPFGYGYNFTVKVIQSAYSEA